MAKTAARTLEPAHIMENMRTLKARIYERFPETGLHGVCVDLVETSRLTADRAKKTSKPHLGIRLAVFAILSAGLALLVYAVGFIHVEDLAVDGRDAANLAQGLESAANLAILFGAAIWFLLTLEQRVKRNEILRYLHELRSFAHVIDMHQLTKDPIVITRSATRTASSPKRELNSFELARYLDYCSEMLSLIGKLAALYGERNRDTEVVAAVNDIETLTTNLGRKIWQKIMMIDENDHLLGSGTQTSEQAG